MGIMVRELVSVLIMAAEPGESCAFVTVADKQPIILKRGVLLSLNASDQTSEQFDGTQKFTVEMDLGFRRQRVQRRCINLCDT